MRKSDESNQGDGWRFRRWLDKVRSPGIKKAPKQDAALPRKKCQQKAGGALVQAFCASNQHFWEDWRRDCPAADPDSVVVTELTGNLFLGASVSVPATVVAALRGCFKFHCELKRDGAASAWREIVGSFGPSYFGSIPELTKSRRSEIEEETQAIYRSLDGPEALLELDYKGMPVGDLVYDSAMRIKPCQATVWKLDDRVLVELRRVLHVVAAVDVLCSRYRVRAAVLSRMNNSFIGTMLRAFVFRGVESYQGYFRVTKHRELPGRTLAHNMKPTPRLLQMAMTEHREQVVKAANAYFEERFAGHVAPGAAPGGPERSMYENAAAFCAAFGLDPARPCVFVMLHALNDFPHLFERNAFQDYYHWATETLAGVAAIDNVNWIFKQHPFISLYPDDGDLAGKVRSRAEPHIRFIDSDVQISRRSLARVAHAIVTCLGTAAIEYGAWGIPAVVAGESFYTGFGICHECFEKSAYFETLRGIGGMPRLTPEQREMSKVILYLSSADLNTSPFALLPAYAPAEALKPDMGALLKHIMRQQSSPAHRRSLRALRAFIEDPDADQFLDPNIYPWFDLPGLER